jgi:hypothetical protein
MQAGFSASLLIGLKALHIGSKAEASRLGCSNGVRGL